MIAVAAAGASCGLGVLLMTRGWRGRERGAIPTRWARRLIEARREDRAILVLSERSFTAAILGNGIAGATLCGLVLVTLFLINVDVPKMFAPLGIAVGAVLGVVLYLENVSKRAASARRTFSYALSSYLDLASVLLAGGAGSETALFAAASTGDSWSFRMIREALETARATRTPMWRVFGDLGRRLGVVDLERLSGSMQLAGEQGAKVRLSLSTQADALRTRQIAEIEAQAQAATERMGIPTVLLFVGFIALLGYPALDLVVGQM
ncbi:MAG: type II secretion system F family protein [Acidobacteria bacterium]|nr:type II secretion system F family protein [Acidobacteriota bacterium]